MKVRLGKHDVALRSEAIRSFLEFLFHSDKQAYRETVDQLGAQLTNYTPKVLVT